MLLSIPGNTEDQETCVITPWDYNHQNVWEPHRLNDWGSSTTKL